MTEQQTFTSPKRIEMHYGAQTIQVSPEEADRVEDYLRTGWKPSTDLSSAEVLVVQDTRGNEHSLWVSPGVPISISRPNSERKPRVRKASFIA